MSSFRADEEGDRALCWRLLASESSLPTPHVSALPGEPAVRCDALGNLTQTRTKVPQKQLTTGLYPVLIGTRAILPAEAEITVKPRPCWERTNWNSPGLWGAPWGLVAPRVVMPMPLAPVARDSG